MAKYAGELVLLRKGQNSLYENGYISVHQGGRIGAGRADVVSNKLVAALPPLIGRLCTSWNPESARYFEWHYQEVFGGHLNRYWGAIGASAPEDSVQVEAMKDFFSVDDFEKYHGKKTVRQPRSQEGLLESREG